MAYSEFLADQIRQELERKKIFFEERKMMGGLCFMVDGKMCVGVVKEDLMARVDPNIYEACLLKTGARPMDFTKRPMKGFVFVDADGYDSSGSLEYWVNLCLEFNPLAKASPSKKKKKD